MCLSRMSTASHSLPLCAFIQSRTVKTNHRLPNTAIRLPEDPDSREAIFKEVNAHRFADVKSDVERNSCQHDWQEAFFQVRSHTLCASAHRMLVICALTRSCAAFRSLGMCAG